MKILQVLQFFSPVHGGSAEVPYQLCLELVKRGHEITIYTSDYKLSKEYIASLGDVRVFPFRSRINIAKFNVSPGIINQARNETGTFDIIHMHNYRTFQNVVVHHYARKFNIPYVLQSHGSLISFFQRGTLKRGFDILRGNRLLRDASCLLAISGEEKEQYRSMGVPEEKIEIVSNGLSLKEFFRLPEHSSFKRKQGLKADEIVVLYLGRIEKLKGLDLLLKAFSLTQKIIGNLKLVIAGPDEGYSATLKELASKLGLQKHVLFTGPLYGQEKLEAYRDAAVFVLPSYYEIFGISALEACACGIPVIVSDRCGVADIIKNYAWGYIVPCETEPLSDKMIHVLSNDNNTKQKREAVQNDFLKHFDWEEIAGKVEGVYLSVLHR